MMYLGRNNGKSHRDMKEVIGLMASLQSIFKEVESFVIQIILDNFDEETSMNLSTKVGVKHGGIMSAIEVYNSATNTNVVYDMTIFDLLQFCTSKTLEGLLNEKVIAMVEKSKTKAKSDSIQTVYLEHSL